MAADATMAPRPHDVLLFAAGAGLLAAGAQIKIPLPGSPVPITGQTFVLALLAGWGGTRIALGAVVTYATAAALGLGVLSGGRGGWDVVTGVSGGYILGFAAAAVVIPTLLRRWGRRQWILIWLAIEAGSACVLGLGALGLVLRGDASPPSEAWTEGVWPFLPGDLVKSITAACLLYWIPVGIWAGRPKGASRRSR